MPVNFETFVRLMLPFCYEAHPDAKKQFLYRIYDKEGKQQGIPIDTIRDILSHELFVRSHYSSPQVTSSYGDQVMVNIIDDFKARFDKDHNSTIDLQEFGQIISDADADLMLAVY